MSDDRRPRWFPALLVTLAAAEAGTHLLAPRTRTIKPARIEPRSYFRSEEIERGARFARGQLALSLAGTAVELVALVALVKRPSRVPKRLARLGEGPAAGAAAGAGLSVALSLIGLPVVALSRRRALAVGLVTQTWRAWAADLLKQTAISAPLGGAGGALVVALTRRYPRSWWAPAAVGSLGAVTLFAALGPVVLDPIFNSFTALPEGQTRADVFDLAGAAGVRSGRCSRSTPAAALRPRTPM